jgi:hypothetical protein
MNREEKFPLPPSIQRHGYGCADVRYQSEIDLCVQDIEDLLSKDVRLVLDQDKAFQHCTWIKDRYRRAGCNLPGYGTKNAISADNAHYRTQEAGGLAVLISFSLFDLGSASDLQKEFRMILIFDLGLLKEFL